MSKARENAIKATIMNHANNYKGDIIQFWSKQMADKIENLSTSITLIGLHINLCEFVKDQYNKAKELEV